MKKTSLKKSLSLILCTVLIAATALFAGGCGDKNKDDTNSVVSTVSTQLEVASAEEEPQSDVTGVMVIGNGNKTFGFTVSGSDGEKKVFEVHTDQVTVGDALIEVDLIDGEQGPYGLYVKTVNGETFDYDKDGKYWAFYVNDEYALTGVESTNIEEGVEYSFRLE